MLDDFNKAFRNRIGFPEYEPIIFENLNTVLEKTARTLPFENLAILANQTKEITKDNLIRKMIQQKTGGVCYELNAILYLFLQENGLDVSLIRGAVYNEREESWSETGQTHAANLVFHHGEPYLVDTGFGSNLPLTPVPLTGETIVSASGEFRVKKEKSPYGDYILELKLKHKHTEWKTGYAFDSKIKVNELSELNGMQEVIMYHPASPFNKKPLVTRRTERGTITLTDTSLTEWTDEEQTKQEVTEETFHQAAQDFFGIDT